MNRRSFLTVLAASLLAIAGCNDQNPSAGTANTEDGDTSTTSSTPESTGTETASPSSTGTETTVLYRGETRLKVEAVSSTPTEDEQQLRYVNLTQEQKDVFDEAQSKASAPYDGEFDFENGSELFVSKDGTTYRVYRVSA